MFMNSYLRTEEEKYTIALCKQAIIKPISLDEPKSADTIIKTLRE